MLKISTRASSKGSVLRQLHASLLAPGVASSVLPRLGATSQDVICSKKASQLKRHVSSVASAFKLEFL